MKHIRKFETTADFNAEIYTSAVPNVSLVTQTNAINYLPEPEWVEIAGVKWATKNLGAATIFDTGLYYQWGDTQGYTVDQIGTGEGKKDFSQYDYKYYDADYTYIDPDTEEEITINGVYTKYNYKDGNLTLDPEDDAVTTNWGDNWRIPSLEDVQKLITACYINRNDQEYPIYPIYGEPGPQGEPTIAGYYPGYVFTDKNDSSKKLFFPDSNNIFYTSPNPSNMFMTNELTESGSDCGGSGSGIVTPTAFICDINTSNNNPESIDDYFTSMKIYGGFVIRPVRTV